MKGLKWPEGCKNVQYYRVTRQINITNQCVALFQVKKCLKFEVLWCKLKIILEKQLARKRMVNWEKAIVKNDLSLRKQALSENSFWKETLCVSMWNYFPLYYYISINLLSNKVSFCIFNYNNITWYHVRILNFFLSIWFFLIYKLNK